MPRKSRLLVSAEAQQLRSVRHRHAKEAARLLRAVHAAAEALVALEAKIDDEAKAIAGDDWRVYHAVGFLACSDDTVEQVHNNGEVLSFPFHEISQRFDELASEVEREARAAEPPELPCEGAFDNCEEE